jgi:hypothetical protein
MSNRRDADSDIEALNDALLGRLASDLLQSKCSFAKLIERLGPEAQTLIVSLMANKKVSSRAIHAALRKAGAQIGRDTISDHRNRVCVCSNPRLRDDLES